MNTELYIFGCEVIIPKEIYEGYVNGSEVSTL